MVIKIILFSILFVINLTITAQQAYTFKGIVTDSVTKKELSYASVVIFQDKLIKCYSKTNDKGTFEFDCKTSFPCIIEVSIVGYNSKQIFLNTVNDNTFNFQLIKSIVKQDSVKVETKINYYKKGDTTFIKASNFYKGDEENLGDLLKKIPSIEMSQSGSITIGGKSVDRILVEGKDMFGTDYAKLVNNLTPKNISDLQFIENYKEDDANLKQKQENVLNIKFKNHNKIRGGKILGGTQINEKNNQIKSDLLFSIAKVNGFNIINYNQLGETSDVLLGSDYSKPYQALIPLSIIKDKEPNSNINVNILKPKNFLNHKTALIDNNQLYEINNKLKIRQQFCLFTEKLFPISNNEENLFFNGALIASYLEEYKTFQQPQKAISKTFLDYKVNKHSRFKLEVDIRKNKEFVNSNGLLNRQLNDLKTTRSNFSSFISAEYKHYFKGINFITYTIDYLHNDFKLIQNELGREFINFNDYLTTVNDVKYKEYYKVQSINYGLGYTFRSKKKNRDVTFNLLKNTSNYKIDNNFKGKFNNQNDYIIFNDFSKAKKAIQNILITPISFYSQSLKRTTNINFNPQFYKNQNEKSRIITTYNLNHSINITKKNRLSITLSNSAEQGLVNLYNFNLLLNKSTVLLSNSVSNFIPRSNYSSLVFSHSKSLKKYTSFGISYNTKKNEYINNELNTNFYRLINIEKFSGNNIKSLNLFGSLSSQILNNKSSISLFLTQSYFMNTEKQNNTLYTTNNTSTKAITKLILDLNYFSINVENRIGISKSYASNTFQKIELKELLNIAEVKIAISKKVFFSFESYYFYTANKTNTVVNELVLNANIKQVLKKAKFRITYSINNLTNNKFYNKFSQSVISKQNTSIPLIPFNFQVKLDYQF